MSLRPVHLWLTLDLALIIQCLSRSKISLTFTYPYHVFAHPSLKTTGLGNMGSLMSHKPIGPHRLLRMLQCNIMLGCPLEIYCDISLDPSAELTKRTEIQVQQNSSSYNAFSGNGR
jgi:hypothetical protein